ncbi:unnamed protein product [Heterosigma akashiwo]
MVPWKMRQCHRGHGGGAGEARVPGCCISGAGPTPRVVNLMDRYRKVADDMSEDEDEGDTSDEDNDDDEGDGKKSEKESNGDEEEDVIIAYQELWPPLKIMGMDDEFPNPGGLPIKRPDFWGKGLPPLVLGAAGQQATRRTKII